jgi:hypothetical protein
MFNELNASFPDHSYFYEVTGHSLTDAMENCARLAAGDSHVINYNGKIIFASQQQINTAGISWLTDIAEPGTVDPVVEAAPASE